MSASAFGRR